MENEVTDRVAMEDYSVIEKDHYKLVIDADGDTLFTVPFSFDNAIILHMVAVYNKAWGEGVEYGKRQLRYGLKSLLDM